MAAAIGVPAASIQDAEVCRISGAETQGATAMQEEVTRDDTLCGPKAAAQGVALAGALGTVTLGCRYEVPAGWSLSSVAMSAGSEDTKRRLLASAMALGLGVVNSSEAVAISVAASQREQCLLRGTRYEPNLQGTLWAKNIAQCQAICASMEYCAHFTFWPRYGGCLLQGSTARPVDDANATAGPRVCPPVPFLSEPKSMAEGMGASDHSGFWWGWLLVTPLVGFCLLVCVLSLVYLHWSHERDAKPVKRGLRSRQSREAEPEYHQVSQDPEHPPQYSAMGLEGSGVSSAQGEAAAAAAASANAEAAQAFLGPALREWQPPPMGSVQQLPQELDGAPKFLGPGDLGARLR